MAVLKVLSRVGLFENQGISSVHPPVVLWTNTLEPRGTSPDSNSPKKSPSLGPTPDVEVTRNDTLRLDNCVTFVTSAARAAEMEVVRSTSVPTLVPFPAAITTSPPRLN